MPYLSCPGCGLNLYTAATLDPKPCPHCGSALAFHEADPPEEPRSILSARGLYTTVELARRGSDATRWPGRGR
jgi:hypothetical protein